MYIIGYLELMFCAVTSLEGLSSQDLSGENGSDLFAAIFLFISIAILAFIPFRVLYIVLRHKERLNEPEI